MLCRRMCGREGTLEMWTGILDGTQLDVDVGRILPVGVSHQDTYYDNA